MIQCARFKRGQVWFVEDIFSGSKFKNHSHLLAKTRPYLILTADSVLETESEDLMIIQAVPITSTVEVNNLTVIHPGVRFYAPKGLNRVIINQVTSIDAKFFKRYLYSVPELMVDEISELICARMGLTKTTVNSAYITSTYIDTDMFSEITTPTATKHTETNEKPAIEDHDNAAIKKKQRSWTISMARDFCKLYEERDYDKLMVKFGFTTKQQIYGISSYLRKLATK